LNSLAAKIFSSLVDFIRYNSDEAKESVV
jgi:hypothetical protein